MSSEKKGFIFLPRIINGGIAGFVGMTCVFRIDLVKTRLQEQQATARLYNGVWDCGVKTLKANGFRGMYRGLAVNLLLITPEKAIILVSNDYFRYFLRGKDNKLTLFTEGLAGSGAGMCQAFVTTPMELLKIQLQLQDEGRTRANNAAGSSGAVTRLSATKIAMDLFRERGIFGLYKGLRATWLRDAPFGAIYFPLFAHLNHLGVSDAARNSGNPDNKAPFWVSFLAGCAAGTVAAAFVTPFDVVKTRIQARQTNAKVRFNGIIDCFRKTYHSEGFSAFFNGVSCRVLKIGPLFGIAQTVYYLGVGEFLLGVAK